MPPAAGPTLSRPHARTRRRTRRRESRCRLPPQRETRDCTTVARARRLRRRLRRRPVRAAHPRHGRPGPDRPAQPRPPRRVRRRPGHRRRRRHPDPDPGRVPAGGRADFALPAGGCYAAGMAFLPAEPSAAAQAMATVERIAAEEGLAVLGWREVPHDPTFCGRGARAVMPRLRAAVRGRRHRGRERARPWSGWRSACASAPSTRPALYFPRCPRGRSSTRAC